MQKQPPAAPPNQQWLPPYYGGVLKRHCTILPYTFRPFLQFDHLGRFVAYRPHVVLPLGTMGLSRTSLGEGGSLVGFVWAQSLRCDLGGRKCPHSGTQKLATFGGS